MIGRLRPNAVKPGELVDVNGRVIGRHQGIIHFTVGQRRGLGIASSAPLYVVRLDGDKRRVVVGPREALRMDRIMLRDVNWIGDSALDRAVGNGLEMSCGCDRPVCRSQHGCAPSTAAMKSSWSRERKAYRRVRPAFSMTRPGPGARARWWIHREREREERDSQRRGARQREPSRLPRQYAGKNFRQIISGRGMAADIDPRGSQRLMNAGHRSVTSYSARCSSTAANRPSPRPTRWRPDSRCRRRHRIVASDYSRTTRLCGVDISEPMLRKAQSRVRALGFPMSGPRGDGRRDLAFPDAFFDAVVAQYVITAVPDPEAAR